MIRPVMLPSEETLEEEDEDEDDEAISFDTSTRMTRSTRAAAKLKNEDNMIMLVILEHRKSAICYTVEHR